MRRLRWATLLAAGLLVACGDDDTVGPGGTGGNAGAGGCLPGETSLDDGSCLVAGTQPNGCAAGELYLAESGICLAAGVQRNGCAAGELEVSGDCVPAGIPPDACAEGFVHDGDAGCEPVLPTEPCEFGEMAVVGETSCRVVAPCGSAPWGSIPVEPSTVYVDAAATPPGTGSDTEPFVTIQQAVAAAVPGAVVAVAAGSYVEDVHIQGKAVRLWGRCPGLVEIVGSSGARAAVVVDAGADGFELHDIAVTGAAQGVSIGGSSAVLLERVWIHDTASFGVEAFDAGEGLDTAFALQSSLVERASGHGVWIAGSVGAVEATVVRDTAADGGMYDGWGITVLEDETTFRHASMTLQSSLVERNAQVGVLAHAADADIEASVIRDTLPNTGNRFGRAVVAQSVAQAQAPANVTVRGCVIERALDGGIMVAASNATIEHTVVRDVQANLDQGDHGSAIAAQHDPLSGAPSNITLRQSLVERGTEAAVFLAASDGLIEGVYVRQSQPRPDGTFGRGIAVQRDIPGNLPGRATIRGTVVEDSRDVGVFIEGSEVTLEGVLVRDTLPRLADELYGWGVNIQDNTVTAARSSVSLLGSVVERSRSMGVMVGGSDVQIEGVRIDSTSPREADGRFGRGLNVQDNDVTGQRSVATVRSLVVDQSHEVGLLCGGSDGTLDAVVVRNTQPGPVMGSSGRGIVIQINPATQQPAAANVRWSLVEQNHDVGLFVGGATVQIESTLVRRTQSRQLDGAFGDGIGVLHVAVPTTAHVLASRIEASARGGLANFGADVDLASSAIVCNHIDLNGETVQDVPYDFLDLGGNACGCSPDDDTCRVLSSNLVPPQVVEVD